MSAPEETRVRAGVLELKDDAAPGLASGRLVRAVNDLPERLERFERAVHIVMVVDAEATLIPRLRVALAQVLGLLGVPREAIERENAAMAEVTYGEASNRQVLGIRVDFAKSLPFYLEDGDPLLHVSLKLAETPAAPSTARTRARTWRPRRCSG
jgi:hypothetical protein